MNTSAQRFTTKARTWLFIAGLTALLIGIGALIGGMFLYAFVALAVVVNVLGYWFSDRLALKASRAKPVEPGTNQELEAMVQDLAQRAQVPAPRLYTISSEQPNAFATGRNPEHAAVAVTDGLLQQLPAEQVKSVLAHEFGHIKNRDILVSSIAAMVAGAIAAIANVLQFSLLFGGDEEDAGPLGWIGLIATIVLAPLAASLLQLAVSRQREHSPMRPGLSSSAARDRSRMRSRRSNAALRASRSTSTRRRPRSTSSIRSGGRASQHSSPPTPRSPSAYAGSGHSTMIRRSNSSHRRRVYGRASCCRSRRD